MSHDAQRRLRQLQRVLLLVELLSPLRYGATAAELAQDVAAELGDFNERTIRRDLDAMRQIGLVVSYSADDPHRTSNRGRKQTRWFWSDRSPCGLALRSAVDRTAATAMNIPSEAIH